MIEVDIKSRWYFLPEDGQACQTEFLNLLNGGYQELWICAYGFTLQAMFPALKVADAKGTKIHVLLDHTQESGRAEAPLVKDLASSLKNGDITITTAGLNSGKPSQIWHWKGLVARFDDGNSDISRFSAQANGQPPVYFCWQGSTNFSASAWDQGNDASIFANDQWALVFIAQQQQHIAWARANEPQYQINGF
jgi:hypothetical protein